MNLQQLSQVILLGERNNQPTTVMHNQLSQLNPNELRETLSTDDKRKAFWINIFNAYSYKFIKENPHLLTTKQGRKELFKTKKIHIANVHLSLHDILHGILRRSKLSWSYGYLQKPFVSDFEKKFRVTILDYRIHFALNWGALSCPGVNFYEPETLREQLHDAGKIFLKEEAEYIKDKNYLNVPALFQWYRADFGGNEGIISIMKRHNIISEDKNPKIFFKDFVWAM